MADLAVAVDRAARDRIVDDLASTLFVEAGAGSGKTAALVERVIALVTNGGVELDSIAAITFTEKAAAELRDRVRRRLETRADGEADPRMADRCRLALDQLDAAAIGTLHGFARRLLIEHPIEAGLPPRIEVIDEVTSGIEFDRRWRDFRDQMLADPTVERTLLLLFATGVRPEALRALAAAFDQNWDLVDDRVPPVSPDPPPIWSEVDRALLRIEEVCAEAAACTDTTDKLVERLGQIADHAGRLRRIEDETDLLERLGEDAPLFRVGRCGRKDNWKVDIGRLRARVREAGDDLARIRETVAAACARRLGSYIRTFTLGEAAERRRRGRLEFHDLLVMARGLLREPVHGPAVRDRLHRRYSRLLLDEFQDTDPIQIELAVRIAAREPRDDRTGRSPWFEVTVAPGHLFVVGDAKQSIYRFRRADIATFQAARDRLAAAGGNVALTTNFRTGEPVVAWVNETFARLMSEPPDTRLPVPSQADYTSLQAVRRAAPDGPPVSVIGRQPHPRDTQADGLRSAEAADVVGTVARIVAEGWSVEGATGWRPARLGDIAILVPARTSLPFLEEALGDAGIAYRAESSSLVYATRAVRDLLMVLRAVDDPTNYLRIVSALRTPLMGCGDDDLFRFKVERGGRWNYLAGQPDGVPVDDPVRVGLAYLRSLHDDRRWRSPSELLDRIARDRRAFELGFAEGRPRDVWRRLRFVIDQARGWSDTTGGGLREYVQWVDLQAAEGARVAEAVLPETDDDAVRILTIHAAKGLEFPITIVSGLSTVPSSRRAAAEVVFPSTGSPVGYRFGKHVVTDEFSAWLPIDEQMAFDERVRLLYVACTRARDHLVVSLHRKERAAEPKTSSRTNAELLVDGMGEVLDSVPDAATASDLPLPAQPAARRLPPMPRAQWTAELAAALDRGRQPTTVAATALAGDGYPDRGHDPDPGLQKRPRHLDLPPWLKGRYGTAVGRAVHGVLQTVDLATGAGLPAAVAAQCQAEAIPDRADDVRRLVENALASPSVRQAAGGSHWREVYACTPVDGGRLLEGYVDLLYRGPDGLVVVDYKTAATSDPDELDRRAEGYRFQGAAYALTVAAATAEPVVQVIFLFLTPGGAVERDLPDLEDSLADVRAAMSAGAEVVVD